MLPASAPRRTKVTLLTKNVQKPKKPFMTNPAMMHLISEIPEPAAYFAKDRTRCAATNEKAAYRQRLHEYLALLVRDLSGCEYVPRTGRISPTAQA